MYYLLLILNCLLLIYAVWSFISPKTALFFIPDKSKRKRFPCSLIAVGVYIVAFIILGSVVEDSPERKEEIRQKELAIAQQREKETQEALRQHQDSLVRSRVDAINKLVAQNSISREGPESDIWRYQQYVLAERDSLNLEWVEYTLNNKFSVERESKLYNQLFEIISNAVNPQWQQGKFSSYYENPAKYNDTIIAHDGYAIQKLMDLNNKKAIRLVRKLNSMTK